MKPLFKVIAIVIAITLSTSYTFSQSNLKGHSGLYMTTADYNNKKLSYEIDCRKESHKIKADKLFNTSKLVIIHDGKKYNYEKKNLFGFRDCNNHDFRFIDNKEYQVLDPEGFYLYSNIVFVNNGKTHTKKTAYYFSKQSDGDVQPLTLESVKAAFPDNHKFHDLLDAQFKAGDNLGMYDDFHKGYKINHIYSQSIK